MGVHRQCQGDNGNIQQRAQDITRTRSWHIEPTEKGEVFSADTVFMKRCLEGSVGGGREDIDTQDDSGGGS